MTTSAVPTTNAEGNLAWNPSVGLYHKPAKDNRESYGGIVAALQDHMVQLDSDIIKAYPHNFAGIIAAIQDLNVSANDPPVIPDVKPPGGIIIIDPITGDPEWDQIVNPVDGTLWFDTRQGRLFIAIDRVWWQTNGADGLAAVTATSTPPDIHPVLGQFWWDSSSAILYVFDGQWLDVDGNIDNVYVEGSTPIWKAATVDPAQNQQTTMSLPLGNLTTRFGDDNGGILPDLDPDDYNVQADYNVYLYDALLALEAAAQTQTAVEVGETAPSTPAVGDLWYDTSTLDLSVWYVDDDGGQWVPTSATYNYDADISSLQYRIANETASREQEIVQLTQRINDLDFPSEYDFRKLNQDIRLEVSKLRNLIPSVAPYATTDALTALGNELRQAIANHSTSVEVDTSNLATKVSLEALKNNLSIQAAGYVTQSQLGAVRSQIPSIQGLATNDFVTETFNNITTTFLPRGGGELTGSFTMVKEDYSLPVFNFATAPHYGHNAFKFQTALNTTTTFGTTEAPYELGWQFGSEEDYCWIHNGNKVFSISKEGPACSTLILGDFSPNGNDGRVLHNKIDLKQKLTAYQFAFESMRQGVANATDFDSLKSNIISALASV